MADVGTAAGREAKPVGLGRLRNRFQNPREGRFGRKSLHEIMITDEC